MEATRILAAKGRYHEINDQVWASLSQSQREQLLYSIPVTKEFDLYTKLLPDPKCYPDWYIDRAIMTANLVGPSEALKLLRFANKSTVSPMLKKTMDSLLSYSKLQTDLAMTYQRISADRAHEKTHVFEIIENLRFPSNLADMFIEPWLCVTLLTADFSPEISCQLSSKLVLENYEDALFSLSELNYRQVGLTVEQNGPQELDLSILLSSLETSQTEGLKTAKAMLGPAGFDIDTIHDLSAALSQIISENQALAVSAADEHCDWSLLEPAVRSNNTGLSSVNLGLAFECLSHL